MPDIINNVAETLMWDIFLMGVFTLLVLALGIMWLLSTSRGNFVDKLRYLAKKVSDLGLARAAVGLVIVLTAVYYVGIISNNYSDSWIDKSGWKHLFLRPKEQSDDKSGQKPPKPKQKQKQKQKWLSDDQIKVKLFGRIYRSELDSLGVSIDQNDPNSVDENAKHEIVDFYYYAKNKLWKDDIWRSYILYSQKIINISRVWCLGFFVLFVLASVRLLVYFMRFALWKRKNSNVPTDQKPGFEVLWSLGVIALAIAGYWVGGAVWQRGEEEIDSKIFGVYRSEFGAPPRIANLLTTHKDDSALTELERDRLLEASELIARKIFGVYRSEFGAPPRIANLLAAHKDDSTLTELETDRVLEASGVAQFEGHLLIVNDKDNYLYVANPESSYRALKMIEVPEFGEAKVKFEGIAFHRESGYFYLTGAHYATRPAYQKVFRFKLQRTSDSWRAVEVEPLSISDSILPYMSDVNSVEGLAVSGTREAPELFVGIRSRTPGRFTILEFHWEKSKFVLNSSHEIRFEPTHAAKVPYHLSGLEAMSESELLVLASTEDDNNCFHGNRIYTIDMVKWNKAGVTREFAVGQKAEGITTWRTSEGKRRMAIVFDNDYEKTKQPSRLLVTSSIDALSN